MSISPMRTMRISKWLAEISDELNKIYSYFDSNLISKEDIGESYYRQIMHQLLDANITIDDILYCLENNVGGDV
jgi:hypothetical protein